LPKSFEDAVRRNLAVEEELERVCDSSHFRTSRRSCEFLQYIVRVTLDGRMDSLKERSIGIDLFGRDASYEPSSDATVRVRANEVRKRLSTYYASQGRGAEVRIELPTGSYVPRFLPPSAPTTISPNAGAPVQPAILMPLPAIAPAIPAIPPIGLLTLVRPALVALLICTLLLRHQLENREDYLRFWDRVLSGRSAILLSVASQDRGNLASSLYPLVWVAGRYGVETAMEGDSLTGAAQGALATVQVSYSTPPALTGDSRLRWSLNPPAETVAAGTTAASRLADRGVDHAPDHPADRANVAQPPVASAALLTILPEDPATVHVQGTDADAIRRLLEELTSSRNFPSAQADRIDVRHPFQILLFRSSSGQWKTESYLGGA
jgi:hypothetical protein